MYLFFFYNNKVLSQHKERIILENAHSTHIKCIRFDRYTDVDVCALLNRLLPTLRTIEFVDIARTGLGSVVGMSV